VATSAPEVIVLYDSDCGFCKWSLDKILAWDRRRALRPVPIQSEEGERLLVSLPRWEWLESWHLVKPDGSVHSAGAGAEPLFEVLPFGKPFALFARTFPALTDWGYRQVAGNRSRLAKLVGADAGCKLRR
jgi:predicted DCC family thiol-disulfide oxidoreductase YuxK